MGVLVSDAIKLEAINAFVAGPLAPATLHLFKNNYVPVHGMVPGSFVELTGASVGYSPISLGAWSPPALGIDLFYTTQETVQSFLNSGLANWEQAYGWYYLDSTGFIVISAGRFALPITNPPGQTIDIVPVFAFGSEY